MPTGSIQRLSVIRCRRLLVLPGRHAWATCDSYMPGRHAIVSVSFHAATARSMCMLQLPGRHACMCFSCVCMLQHVHTPGSPQLSCCCTADNPLNLVLKKGKLQG